MHRKIIITVGNMMLVSMISSIVFQCGCVSNSQGQSVQLLDLEFKLNQSGIKNIRHIPDFNLTKIDTIKIQDKNGQVFDYFAFSMGIVLPNDASMSPLVRKNEYRPVALLARKIYGPNDKKLEITFMDSIQQKEFTKRDTITLNNSTMIKHKFLIDYQSGNDCAINIPLIISADYFGGDSDKYSIKLQNAMQYFTSLVIGNDTVLFYINAHFGPVKCGIRKTSWKEDSVEFYDQNQPFQINNKWYKFTNLDVCKKTILLHSLNDDEIIYGYKVGQYFDIDNIKILTENNLLENQLINWELHDYILLHFWGEWCHPCVGEMPQVKSLDQHLSQKKSVLMIHYPSVFNQTDVESLKLFLARNQLSKLQSVCVLDNSCPIDIFKSEQCHVGQYVRCYSYPKYLLIDKKGKIILWQRDIYDIIEGLKKINLY